MKLTEGTYENVITNGLKQDIEETTATGLVCKQDDVDGAETPEMLTEHLAKIIRNRLSDENLNAGERSLFVNRIIDVLGEDSEEKVADDKKMLSAVVSAEEDARLVATKSEIVRPLTGFRTSSLFTGGQSKVPMNAELVRDIESADTIYMIVSFLKMSGINLIYDHLKRFCGNPKHKLRVITTTYCGVTDAKAVERLSTLPNTEIMISYNTQIERLHAKSYIFERNSGFSTAYIGSSNLSKSAQTDGLEWNIRVTNVENPHIIKSALATFNLYWNSHNFENFSVGGIEKLNRELRNERESPGLRTAALAKFNILPHQKQILDRLAVIRENGVSRNLIVAATGTGKTVISAFDYQVFANANPHNNRILFIAHRQEIIKQALDTYRSVLGDPNFGEMWVGNIRPTRGFEHLFITVQTFNSNFDNTFAILSRGYYDYIVIDEAHHLVADSYRKVLEHFDSPKLMLGLTATPERMDGESLLPDFCNQISAEIRLPQALEEGLLTPFQYLCISDNTDLSDDDLMQGSRYVVSKLTERLCNEERVRLIVNRLQYYLADEMACRALGFCSSKTHAKFMADSFNKCGLKAAYLTSDNDEERRTLNHKLAKAEINYLFVVDIFNEGVDIPAVDTVLFLRPTESLTVFLQQLGRGLRLYPGKQQLTVFDFVAQLNNKYDYVSRFRSLMTRADNDVVGQIKNGFTLLPHGCSIHMEEKAQEHVLQNIKAAIYDRKRLVTELREYSHCPSLKEFVDNNGQDIRLIYKNGCCWSRLKRDAGWCDYSDDDNTSRFEKGLANLIHSNSRAYLNFVKSVVLAKEMQQLNDKHWEAFSVMLYYALYGERISKLGFRDLQEAFELFRKYPVFTAEVCEIVDFLLPNIMVKTYQVGEGMPDALEQYGCYTREEVFAIFGRQTADKKMQGSVAGVFKIDEFTELFFVTLNKSDKDFSASTMYDDHVVCENRFHWKSQNTDSHNGRGRRFVEQKVNGKKFILFVREYKKDGYGNTCPFICFGLVDYIESRDDKPMSIDWRTHHPILPQFLSAV